ncbi:MAG: excinuclease ABC subunit UvrB [Planctomycetes bacterium]|nr:excinuclease ABC subunit UvrB [Planctomycetota bacterium]
MRSGADDPSAGSAAARRGGERPPPGTPAGFQLTTRFVPSGDQQAAIEGIVGADRDGVRRQVLLGVTGSGKTFTVANVVAQLDRPALLLAPNKTLAAQLFDEMRELFPHNAVEYFVSFYDYYQPEAYLPTRDVYIEKDASINDRIDRMRHAATKSALTRRDVLIVASVSCIYGLGSPDAYRDYHVWVEEGDRIDRDVFLRRLVRIRYERNDMEPGRGRFRVRGDVVEVGPADADDRVLRIEWFGDEVERIEEVDLVTGEVLGRRPAASFFPSSHYMNSEEALQSAIEGIRIELDKRLVELRRAEKIVEADRLARRVRYDLELLRETGFCPGIENYSRHLDGRRPGEAPATLLDYLPEDFLLVVDESHVAVPQIGGMYAGDRRRKLNLVEYGFRLPSALDNRPLTGEEFWERVDRTLFVSATPGAWEKLQAGTHIVEQVIRPTGLVDPPVEVRPARGQVDDLLEEVRKRVAIDERILVTTLTKRMAEDLTEHLTEIGVKARYMHSDISTLERAEILKDLRLGLFDVLVGINLLREGLDLPEVTLVAVLDADKEGFLRSETSLVQVSGRAARNVKGRVLFYADTVTDSMRRALSEMERRRTRQTAWNEEHGVTPTSARRAVRDTVGEVYADRDYVDLAENEGQAMPRGSKALAEERARLDGEMRQAAAELRFEDAAKLRDQLRRAERLLLLRGSGEEGADAPAGEDA